MKTPKWMKAALRHEIGANSECPINVIYKTKDRMYVHYKEWSGYGYGFFNGWVVFADARVLDGGMGDSFSYYTISKPTITKDMKKATITYA